jgi:hypothetical protein
LQLRVLRDLPAARCRRRPLQFLPNWWKPPPPPASDARDISRIHARRVIGVLTRRAAALAGGADDSAARGQLGAGIPASAGIAEPRFWGAENTFKPVCASSAPFSKMRAEDHFAVFSTAKNAGFGFRSRSISKG